MSKANKTRHDVEITKHGAFLMRKHGATARAGSHKNRKREQDRKACRGNFNR